MVVPWNDHFGACTHYLIWSSHRDSWIDLIRGIQNYTSMSSHNLDRQVSVEAFIEEFQRIAVMVPDVSKSRLMMLFSEGLT
jgi:hypothetical protein